MKLSNSNTLFKDFSATSLTHNKSLIPCNSQITSYFENAFTYQKLVQTERFFNGFRANSLLHEICSKH